MSKEAGVELHEVRDKWPEVIKQVYARNRLVGEAFEDSIPVAVVRNVVTVQFVSDTRMRRALKNGHAPFRSVLSVVAGQEMDFCGTVDPDYLHLSVGPGVMRGIFVRLGDPDEE